MGVRDQARWLSADGPKRRRAVKIYTRRGADWTGRFPRIVEAVRKLKVRSVLIDGEGVVCDDAGVSDFHRLHSKLADEEVFLYAFDVLELGGADVRREPLLDRKAKLLKALAKVKDGISFNNHIEDDGRLVSDEACRRDHTARSATYP